MDPNDQGTRESLQRKEREHFPNNNTRIDQHSVFTNRNTSDTVLTNAEQAVLGFVAFYNC